VANDASPSDARRAAAASSTHASSSGWRIAPTGARTVSAAPSSSAPVPRSSPVSRQNAAARSYRRTASAWSPA
jgi:hypothetical protein